MVEGERTMMVDLIKSRACPGDADVQLAIGNLPREVDPGCGRELDVWRCLDDPVVEPESKRQAHVSGPEIHIAGKVDGTGHDRNVGKVKKSRSEPSLQFRLNADIQMSGACGCHWQKPSIGDGVAQSLIVGKQDAFVSFAFPGRIGIVQKM